MSNSDRAQVLLDELLVRPRTPDTIVRPKALPLDLAASRERSERLKCPGPKKVSRVRELKSESHAAFLQAFAACGLNQSELADHLGISRQYVNDMFHGLRAVPDWVLRGMPRSARHAIGDTYLDSVEREAPSSVSGWK